MPASGSYFEAKSVLITGAATGLGRSLALEVAKAGATVLAVDVDAEQLASTVAECRQLTSRPDSVHAFTLDVADPVRVSECADQVRMIVGQLDILINNAGVLAAGRVDDFDLNNYRRIMDANFFGTLTMTKLFLPLLRTSPSAHLVNVSSAFGIMTAPGYSAYSASKFAVRALTEALTGEFADSNLKVTSVIPGGMHTTIARSAVFGRETDRDAVIRGFEKSVARTHPNRAAVTILSGIAAGKRRILVGRDAAIASALVRLLGSRYMDVIRRYM
ncbi:SDR family NAD(P)-dependent oxidoreductase [Rhodococcus sp. NPDC057297]|uniref:SDR family NAD(P)-dependent oxidoreductase n=1 Tax=Rhodococcus sp. NPDC057297 TaxID=3346090 RepID=UPI0036448213